MYLKCYSDAENLVSCYTTDESYHQVIVKETRAIKKSNGHKFSQLTKSGIDSTVTSRNKNKHFRLALWC